MVRVEVYGKPDCALCDEAKDRLRRVQRDLPFELVEVDVTRDASLEARYRNDVPVVLVDGRRAFKHRFTEDAARRRIRRALAAADPTAQRAEAPAAPRARRRVGVAVAAAAALAAVAVLAYLAYDAFVTQPAIAEEAFEITKLPSPIPAPELAVETSDGRVVSLSSLRGQVVFVNFWATWCPPCRAEMPSMAALGRELAREHPGRFRMVAVSVDDGWEPIQEFFPGGPPPELLVALDREQIATRLYYCAARGGCPDSYKFPESYIVDRQGRLVSFVIGPRDWTEPAAKRYLERLIGG